MRPQLLVTPKKGKLLGAKENEGFVDTFDWMKNVCDNLKGDGISIEVDRTDEDAPTIRLAENVMNRISDLSAGECSCDVSAYFEEYDEQGEPNVKLATWTNGLSGDLMKTVDIFAPRGGGGGESSGFTGAVPSVSSVVFNEDGDYKLHRRTVTLTYEKGLLKSVSEPVDEVVFITSPHSGE